MVATEGKSGSSKLMTSAAVLGIGEDTRISTFHQLFFCAIIKVTYH